MNQRRADALAGLIVASVVTVGLLFTWDAYQRQQAVDEMGGMMGGSGMMGSMTVGTPDPIWYLLGTVVVAGALGGGYLVLRPELDLEDGSTTPGANGPETNGVAAQGTLEPEPPGSTEAEDLDASEDTAGSTPVDTGTRAFLEVLPEDERRVLEPVIESPGVTQIALRDRSEFSKSKVSQTVSDLEKRGLLYREKQGRTYRVYPSEEIQN